MVGQQSGASQSNLVKLPQLPMHSQEYSQRYKRDWSSREVLKRKKVTKIISGCSVFDDLDGKITAADVHGARELVIEEAPSSKARRRMTVNNSM